MNPLNLPFPHTSIVGTTGTGKSYAFLIWFRACRYGGIYINYTRIPAPGLIKCSGADDTDDIIEGIRRGDKFNYIPSRNKKRAKIELDVLISELFKACDRGEFTEKSPFVFALDECHNLAREGERNDSVETVATGGRTAGFKAVFITQSPSMAEKILFKMSDVHVMFTLSETENGYFKGKGYDFDTMQKMVRSGDFEIVSHKYVLWRNGLIEGPYEERG